MEVGLFNHMLNKIIAQIQTEMIGILNATQFKSLNDALIRTLSRCTITECQTMNQDEDNDMLLDLFISAKRVEGCSIRTLNYYNTTIRTMYAKIEKPIVSITTDNLRSYLSEYQMQNKSSKTTIDNIRRIMSSFFSWLEDEEYVVKSPVRRIHKVKSGRSIKNTFSDEELEHIRDVCDNPRDLAMIDLLASTGMRVGELVRLKVRDIDFEERECIVLGKGDCERKVYFDARTKIHLQEYLDYRTDSNCSLFVSLNMPFKELNISGVESRLKVLGRRAEIDEIHPHKFRRTLATQAIDKGMPIEQVQRLLGHVRIDTTMHYALVNQSNVKISHRRYIS
jgi:site-specific recombinase XerD